MCHAPTKSRSVVKGVALFLLFKEFIIQITRGTCTQVGSQRMYTLL